MMVFSRKILIAAVAGAALTGTATLALALDCGWPFKVEEWELELVSVTVDGVEQDVDPAFADLSILLRQEYDDDRVVLEYELDQTDGTQRRTAGFHIEPIPGHLLDAIADQGGAQ